MKITTLLIYFIFIFSLETKILKRRTLNNSSIFTKFYDFIAQNQDHENRKNMSMKREQLKKERQREAELFLSPYNDPNNVINFKKLGIDPKVKKLSGIDLYI